MKHQIPPLSPVVTGDPSNEPKLADEMAFNVTKREMRSRELEGVEGIGVASEGSGVWASKGIDCRQDTLWSVEPGIGSGSEHKPVDVKDSLKGVAEDTAKPEKAEELKPSERIKPPTAGKDVDPGIPTPAEEGKYLWATIFADGKTDISFENEHPWSLPNEAKGWIEDFIDTPINWWPISPRRRSLPEGFTRVNWRCVSGQFSDIQYCFLIIKRGSVVAGSCQALSQISTRMNTVNGSPLVAVHLLRPTPKHKQAFKTIQLVQAMKRVMKF